MNIRPYLSLYFNLLIITGLCIFSGCSRKAELTLPVPKKFEGPVKIGTVTAGPFDLHRRYRSMEGPFVAGSYSVSELVSNSQGFIIPEEKISFVENGRKPSMGGGPGMDETSASGSTPSPVQPTNNQEGSPSTGITLSDPNHAATIALGVQSKTPDKNNVTYVANPVSPTSPASETPGRKLYWLKGVTVEILDENDKVIDSEFLCHINIDLKDVSLHSQIFSNRRQRSSRWVTLSQGCPSFFLPEGTAYPLASDEKIRIGFQVANRTTDKHRRVKERVHFYFIPDTELIYPITSLTLWSNCITVVTDGANDKGNAADTTNCSACLPLGYEVAAPNASPNSLYFDSHGRRITGHYVVPPGLHKYSAPWAVNDPIFPKNQNLKVRAVWFHVHPYCQTMSLIHYDAANYRKPLVTGHMSTSNDRGLELAHIDVLQFSKQKAITIPAKGSYEMEAVYNNTGTTPQDSMATMGLFVEDQGFIRPNWALPGNIANNCNLPPPQNTTQKKADPAYVPPFPLFSDSDGPLIKSKKTILLKTSMGPLKLEIDPALAPITATQIYRLLRDGAYNGCVFYRYEPNFLLQIRGAETLKQKNTLNQLRRLPLEVKGQQINPVAGQPLHHHKYALNLGHYTIPDTGVSSFCILLGNAPRLEGKYAVFGNMLDDTESEQTIQSMISGWGGPPVKVIESVDITGKKSAEAANPKTDHPKATASSN